MRKLTRGNFLTLFLFFSVVYMGINATLNVTKCVSYRIKLAQLQALHNDALMKKQALISEFEGYSSQKKYEYFARNYLRYAGKNEIKVVLIKNEPTPQPRNTHIYY